MAADNEQFNLHELAAERKQICILWSIEDVQQDHPWITDEQAWEVLKAVEKHHDCNNGIDWDNISYHANSLYPKPEGYVEPEEEDDY